MRVSTPAASSPVIPPSIHVITISPEVVGVQISALSLAAPVSQAIWGANIALYIPFSIATAITANRLFCVNGAVPAGNVDIGLYDSGGVQLVSSGSTVQAGANVPQYFDIADTALQPGSYYMALVANNVATPFFQYNSTAALFAMMGIVQQAAAFPLPAPAVFAAMAVTAIPLFGISRRASP